MNVIAIKDKMSYAPSDFESNFCRIMTEHENDDIHEQVCQDVNVFVNQRLLSVGIRVVEYAMKQQVMKWFADHTFGYCVVPLWRDAANKQSVNILRCWNNIFLECDVVQDNMKLPSRFWVEFYDSIIKETLEHNRIRTAKFIADEIVPTMFPTHYWKITRKENVKNEAKDIMAQKVTKVSEEHVNKMFKQEIKET